MSEKMLEAICTEVDLVVRRDNEVSSEIILPKLGLGDSSQINTYRSFLHEYANLARRHKDECLSLDKNVDKDINLGRIAWNAIYGGIAGSIFDPKPYFAMAGAVIGAAITAYDELKKKGLDFNLVFWGAVVGGGIGELFEPEGIEYISYAGAAIGMTLGSIKSWRGRETTEEGKAMKELRLVDHSYKMQKEHLIETVAKSLRVLPSGAPFR